MKEEKARGITIELGFADFELAPGRIVSFVDVPGHERFVRHMVAGAFGVDAVMLVVAADEGVMPQTREHLHICRLLGVRSGVVALSKVDLVEGELAEVVRLELREELRGTFLEEAEVVAVSARTGAGLAEIRRALSELFDRVEPRSAAGVARLPVDRVFTMKGFGTVVTGTLVSGALREGEEVEVLPSGRRARIRGIQVHRAKEGRVEAGHRTAVNLQGIDVAEVPRGSTVSHPGALRATRRILARVEWLPHAPQALRRGGTARFHQGVAETTGRLRPLGAEEGSIREVEIRFRDEVVVLPGDRFVLRRPDPFDTVGGGVVVDAHPARGKAGLAAAAGGVDPREIVLDRVRRAGETGREPADLASATGRTSEEIAEILRTLEGEGEIVRAGSVAVDSRTFERAGAAVEDALAAFHREEPLLPGPTRDELRARAGIRTSGEVYRELLTRLAGAGRVRLDGDRVASRGYEVVLSASEAALAERLEARFRDGGLDPPAPESVVREAGGKAASRLVDWLVARGRLQRLRDGRLFHVEPLDDLRRKLAEFAKTSRTIDVGAFKELAGVTRKSAIPLLEQMDAERRTRRVGDVREILTD